MLATQQDSDDSEPETTACFLDFDSSRSRSPAEKFPVVRTPWTVGKENKLLELWQEHECLYSLSDKCHNKLEREKRWAEIAAALELPGEHVFVWWDKMFDMNY